MAFIKVNNANIYYEEHGEGRETIVFAHSMLFNLRMFDEQVAALKSSYRCVLFDFRGQGQSEVTREGYDLDNLAVDTMELIRALDCQPCHFVGFSMGGMVALRIAARNPELIRSLVLIDTSSEPEPRKGYLRNKAMLGVTRSLGPKPIANKVISMFFGPAFLHDPERNLLRKTWKAHFLANDRIGVVRAVRGALSRPGITSEIRHIKAPALILWGDQDHLTDKEKADIMHKHISHSELLIVPKAGHMSPVEEPAFVNHSIRTFLAGLKDRP
jgi:3-oxoadipate enol-lactonase